MGHFALADENNIVVQVITGRNEGEVVEGISDWEAHYSEVTGLNALRTSYNTYGGIHYTEGEPSPDQSKALRKNYAGIGFAYDEARDAFIPPKPYDSWSLNEETCLWEPPVPAPAEGKWTWDEESRNWIELTENPE